MDDQFRDATKKTYDTIYRQSAIETVSKALKGTFVEYQEIAEKMINKIPSAQQQYEPVTAEDFAKTMSENSLYNFVAWHQEALTLMKEQGVVTCKKTM